ncbi:MAG: hypothetical protein RR455_08120 [Bacteroidales bacterium]
MQHLNARIKKIYELFLSKRAKERFEHFIIILSLCSFVLHLAVLMSKRQFGVNLIEALYTPFTIILLYEVYLLVYYLRKSTIEYIGKQYEIITLILIRGVFEEISYRKFDFTALSEAGIAFVVKLCAIILLFYLVHVFYRIAARIKRKNPLAECKKQYSLQYLNIKKILSLILILVFVGILIYSSIDSFGNMRSIEDLFVILKEVNYTFYSLFFTTLILTEVFLLLIIMFYIDLFSIIIRNSAFIISTTLLKMSFSQTGIAFTAMVLLAVGFGVVMLRIYRLYEK